MIGKYRIITLCGSVRFADAFLEAQRRLTLEGNLVLSISPFADVPDEPTKAMLGDMHLRRIDLSDGIFVVNPGGYIGERTRLEIEYARRTGKEVSFLEE